jgi:hypothetical protein
VGNVFSLISPFWPFADFAAITAYNRVMMLIEKVTDLYAERINML